MSGNSFRTSATNAKSFPGLLFSLIRWYPERTSFSTFLVNDCGVSQMLIETPQVISSRLPPSNVDKGNPLCWASTSQRAFSTPALAISCPQTPSPQCGHFGGAGEFPTDQLWRQKIANDVPCSVCGFGIEKRACHRGDLAPATQR